MEGAKPENKRASSAVIKKESDIEEEADRQQDMKQGILSVGVNSEPKENLYIKGELHERQNNQFETQCFSQDVNTVIKEELIIEETNQDQHMQEGILSVGVNSEPKENLYIKEELHERQNSQFETQCFPQDVNTFIKEELIIEEKNEDQHMQEMKRQTLQFNLQMTRMNTVMEFVLKRKMIFAMILRNTIQTAHQFLHSLDSIMD